jgi:hypothetical protein
MVVQMLLGQSYVLNRNGAKAAFELNKFVYPNPTHCKSSSAGQPQASRRQNPPERFESSSGVDPAVNEVDNRFYSEKIPKFVQVGILLKFSQVRMREFLLDFTKPFFRQFPVADKLRIAKQTLGGK